MSKDSPAAHPRWTELVALRGALRSQIAACIADLQALDDSRAVVLGQYAAAFGERMLTLSRLEIEAARLKREIDLVQAALNAGRDVDYDEVDRTLEREFAEWQQRLSTEAEELDRRRRVLDHLVDPAKATDLRRLYRTLVRRLHPDLNPDLPPARQELWHRTLKANDHCDLDELAALELLTREDDGADDPPPDVDSLEAFEQEVGSLRRRHDELLAKLNAQRSQWPFDQMPLLADADAVAARQAELDQRIAAADALRAERRQWLDQLIGS